jgi:hypothetical protein
VECMGRIVVAVIIHKALSRTTCQLCRQRCRHGSSLVLPPPNLAPGRTYADWRGTPWYELYYSPAMQPTMPAQVVLVQNDMRVDRWGSTLNGRLRARRDINPSGMGGRIVVVAMIVFSGGRWASNSPRPDDMVRTGAWATDQVMYSFHCMHRRIVLSQFVFCRCRLSEPI